MVAPARRRALPSPPPTTVPASGWLDRPLSRRAVLAAGAGLGLLGLAGGLVAGPDRPTRPRSLPARPAFIPTSMLEEPALSVSLYLPTGVASDPDGVIYIADSGTHQVRRLDGRGRLTTVAGLGLPGYEGDGDLAQYATLRWCSGVALAPDGSLYLADSDNHCIRRVAPNGIITTVAGTGRRDFGGDGGPATRAGLARPQGLAVGSDGALFIADTGNDRIRRVAPDGTITTIAGAEARVSDGLEAEVVHFGGDGGPATAAQLNRPADVAVSPDGSLFIADTYNGRIRQVDREGIMTTVAGGGTPGMLGDDGPAVAAWLYLPQGVAVSPDGTLVIADSWNDRIRRVDDHGWITTIAGAGRRGFDGDDGPAVMAELNHPSRVAVAVDGTLVIADRGNHRLRRVDAEGAITTIAGTGEQPLASPTPGPSGYVTE